MPRAEAGAHLAADLRPAGEDAGARVDDEARLRRRKARRSAADRADDDRALNAGALEDAVARRPVNHLK